MPPVQLDDLPVFYDTDFGAERFALQQDGQGGTPFLALFSLADGDALDGYALGGVARLQLPTAVVVAQALGPNALLQRLDHDPVQLWALRERPRRLADGAESVVELVAVSA